MIPFKRASNDILNAKNEEFLALLEIERRNINKVVIEGH